MIPPTKAHLQALAGWSLVARHQASDRQHLALCRFGDSCSELSEVVEDVPVPVPLARPAPVPVPVFEPPEVQLTLGHQSPAGVCQHKFDIRTQLCRFCGQTYLKAMQRKPELM
jgi:hypothetical protein